MIEVSTDRPSMRLHYGWPKQFDCCECEVSFTVTAERNPTDQRPERLQTKTLKCCPFCGSFNILLADDQPIQYEDSMSCSSDH